MNLVIKIMINTSIKLAFFLILYHIEICITHGNDDEPNHKKISIFTTKNHMTMNPIFTNFHYLQPQIIFTFFFSWRVMKQIELLQPGKTLKRVQQ